MQISESWLREWVVSDLPPSELAEKLTLAGLEVESIETASRLSGSKINQRKIVVGRIEAAVPHTDADRLRVCEVNIGKKTNLQIVCGAANANPGTVVPVAQPGAKLPALEIKQTEIRGVHSEGMLCSAAELGISDQSGGLMELDSSAPLGGSLWHYLGLDDSIIDIDLTPNRGDCLSVQGIAREVSALTGATMQSTDVKAVKPQTHQGLSIELHAPDGCARFVGRAIVGINMTARTPDWMQQKLLRSGIRSINPVVDITNYVMLETGQPMHAYDYDKLVGGIVVRRAGKREKLKLLDGSTVSLNETNLVIADHKRAVGLAGIMGGESTAISDRTRNIYFEAAFFSPADIIGKARQFGMHTDASHRFERGVNPVGQQPAIERATALLIEIAGGEPGKLCRASVTRSLPKQKQIILQAAELPRMLGIRIPASSVKAILCRLGMSVTGNAKALKVTAPPWRFDISGQHDLVEEVGRCYGFENIPPKTPAATARTGGFPESRVTLSSQKHVLTSRGYFEAINYSFIDPDLHRLVLGGKPGIRLANPLADNMAEMRQSLLPGILTSVVRNQNRQEHRIRLFETGTVFHRNGRKRTESVRMAAVAYGDVAPRQWGEAGRPVDFFDIKGDLETVIGLSMPIADLEFEPAEEAGFHPGQCARLKKGRRKLGIVGRLHPAIQQQLDLDQPVYMFEVELSALGDTRLPRFQTISRFPSVQRDLAVVVGREVEAGQVLAVVRRAAGEHLKTLELFDIYEGERIEMNKKSFAFSLTFQSESSSLKAGDIEQVTSKIITALEASVGAQLRS
ncbi:MAG: phenylalanine--tRNA ligase subunit beta [Gammaproteobacteria bacterium]|nr:phenylalanine--tRNA ligase subunit beta [Gammaproteobacteria bacterium]